MMKASFRESLLHTHPQRGFLESEIRVVRYLTKRWLYRCILLCIISGSHRFHEPSLLTAGAS